MISTSADMTIEDGGNHMLPFVYYAPTKVVFGPDTAVETGKLVKEQGATKVLIQIGRAHV